MRFHKFRMPVLENNNKNNQKKKSNIFKKNDLYDSSRSQVLRKTSVKNLAKIHRKIHVPESIFIKNEIPL